MVTLSNEMLYVSVKYQLIRSFIDFEIKILAKHFPRKRFDLSRPDKEARNALWLHRDTSRANGARFNLLISKAPWIELADLRKIGYVMGLRRIRVGAILESLLLATASLSRSSRYTSSIFRACAQGIESHQLINFRHFQHENSLAD